jgi:hypothetical protein
LEVKQRTKVLSSVALVLCLVICWPVVVHYRIKAKLAAYERQLRAKGEKLTIAEVAPPTSPEGVWSANTLLAAAGRLRMWVPNFTNQPPTMQMVSPGHGIVGWQQEPLPTSDQANVWPSLRTVIDRNEATLAQAHAALQSPQITVPLDYSQGPNLLLPHLVVFKGIAQWFSAETVLALHDRRPEDAWASLEDLVALGQRYQDEPVMISLLVRIAIQTMAVNATWEALQSPDLQEPQLQELQQAWNSMDVLTQAEATLAMERAVHSDLFARGRLSYLNIAPFFTRSGFGSSGLSELAQIGKEVLDNPKEGLNSLARRYPGYWKWKCWQSYDDELADAQTIQAAMEAVRAMREQGAFGPALQAYEQATNAVLAAHPSSGLWMPCSVARDGSVRGFLSRVAHFEIQRSVVVAALALKRYQLKHGAYPAQLSALVPEFLPQAPRDPVDGKSLRYRLNPDGSFLLYSIGEDGVDNGGDPKPSSNLSNAKRWYQARDAVWPSPAAPQEIDPYFYQLAVKRKDVSNPAAEAAYARRYGMRPAPTPPAPAPPAAVTNTPGK